MFVENVGATNITALTGLSDPWCRAARAQGEVARGSIDPARSRLQELFSDSANQLGSDLVRGSAFHLDHWHGPSGR